MPGAGAGESGVESGGESGRCILGFKLEDESGVVKLVVNLGVVNLGVNQASERFLRIFL